MIDTLYCENDPIPARKNGLDEGHFETRFRSFWREVLGHKRVRVSEVSILMFNFQFCYRHGGRHTFDRRETFPRLSLFENEINHIKRSFHPNVCPTFSFPTVNKFGWKNL